MPTMPHLQVLHSPKNWMEQASRCRHWLSKVCTHAQHKIRRITICAPHHIPSALCTQGCTLDKKNTYTYTRTNTHAYTHTYSLSHSLPPSLPHSLTQARHLSRRYTTTHLWIIIWLTAGVTRTTLTPIATWGRTTAWHAKYCFIVTRNTLQRQLHVGWCVVACCWLCVVACIVCSCLYSV